MEPITAISTIAAGLGLLDKFVDLVEKVRGQGSRTHSVEAKQEGNDLTITDHGLEVERIRAEQLQLNEWDDIRYKALEDRVKSNFAQYNALFAQTPSLAVDERVRVEQRMARMQHELCRDFREMIHIYEKTLRVHLADHYSLYRTCGDLLELQ